MTPRLILIMGVSGSGKTTIGSLLAEKIGGRYLEGDEYHPPENKAKMGNAIPLTDEDRWPWFDRLIEISREALSEGQDVVVACSALKKTYREYILRDFPSHRTIHLSGDFETIKKRMDSRQHEYMTSDLLKSQFGTLEEPDTDEEILALSIDRDPLEIVDSILEWLKE